MERAGVPPVKGTRSARRTDGLETGRSMEATPFIQLVPDEEAKTPLAAFVRRHVPLPGSDGDVPCWLAGHGRLAVTRARLLLLQGSGDPSDPGQDLLDFVRHVLHRMTVPAETALEWFRDQPANRLPYLALHECERHALSVLAATGLLTRSDAMVMSALEQGFREEVLAVLGKIVSRHQDERARLGHPA